MAGARFALALLAAAATCAAAPPALPTALPSVDVNVIAFGGDPTGVADSTAALTAALAAVAARGASGGWPSVEGAGGLTLDLAGGVYRVSAPLVVSAAAGARDFTLAHGTLVADDAFPPARFLLELDSTTGVALVDLTLDARHTGGCVKLTDAMQTTVTRGQFLHYASVGLWGSGSGGHELLVDSSFFAEYMYGEPGYNESAKKSGVGIWLDMPDSNVYNSIVRCSRVGAVVRGGGNLLHGTHIYATCSKTGGGGGADVAVALVSDGFMGRVHGCYFDNSPVIVTSMFDATYVGNVFYGLAGLVFAPQAHAVPARGLLASGNVFTSTPDGAPGVQYDASNGTVNGSALSAVVVADNSFDSEAGARTTRPALTLAVFGNATAGWLGTVDLAPHLLFPPVAPAAAAAAAADGGAAAAPSSPPAPWHDGVAFVNALLAARGEPPLGSRHPQVPPAPPVGPSLGDAFGGAFQRFSGSLAVVSGSGSPSTFGLWSLAPTATPGVITAFATIGGDGPFGDWHALLHLQFDQALATGVASASVAVTASGPASVSAARLRRAGAGGGGARY
jgi:hypothetical protein